MKIIPVLDILQKNVVRGIAGRRDEYGPVVSGLCAGSAPIDIAQAFSNQLGLKDIYVADLDAILGNLPQSDICQNLLDAEFNLMVDAGVADLDRASQLLDMGVGTVVVGLETLPSFELLERLLASFSPEQIMFSLDMKQGQLMGSLCLDQDITPLELVQRTVGLGIQRLLVLELADVGTGAGPSTADLCQQISVEFPDVELVAGGGIRNVQDILDLEACGVHGVLVSSALHSGIIGRDVIENLNADRD